jgi:ubiquitin-protein ligase E3 C
LVHLAALGTCPDMYFESMLELVAPLSTFCSLYSLFLLTILDVEFLKGEAIFTKLELIKMCTILRDVCIGAINYMHPDPDNIGKPFSSSAIKKEYADWNSNRTQTSYQQEAYLVKRLRVKHFTHMFQMCCQLVQRLNTRDIRRSFCPEDHWISHNDFNQNMAHSIHVIHRSADFFQVNKIRFGQSSYLFFDENELDFSLSTGQIRCMTIIQELPFTIPFTERLKIFENFTESEPVYPGSGSVYKIRIRRNYFYEDAFENLSHQNAPNLKTSRLVIEMINQYGLDEAGIDGGGLFRDFMLQLLETGFDPNRGFFVMSSDGLLYPNPNVAALVDDYKQHYFFLGRMLAKSIQCEIFSQLKFAGFFMQKILSKYSDTRLDIDYLASFDPEIYKNLIFLKDYNENIEGLDLNFTIQLNEFGESKVVELKPGGKDITVTNDNKIEYIHLMADYKLNKQIQEQVKAFKMGISDIIDLDLLRLFNFNELQNLISGGNESIDVEDWKNYTVYQGNYHKDHPVIETFWEVVVSFSEDEKRKLLRFATSRSFPPLFGFRNLLPNFAIQNSGSTDRLPTASTCLNLLKLPPLEDFDLLKEKLLCAIESDAGFELS